jgi:aminoglycoside/choline kinase family phosphotransferase
VRGVDGDVFTLSELFGTVQNAVWDEARRGIEADPLRRNLQREHLRRMTAAVLGSSAGYPADARALLRRDARQLRDWLDAAANKPGLSAETRAHYAESAETLREALKAPMLRSGV